MTRRKVPVRSEAPVPRPPRPMEIYSTGFLTRVAVGVRDEDGRVSEAIAVAFVPRVPIPVEYLGQEYDATLRPQRPSEPSRSFQGIQGQERDFTIVVYRDQSWKVVPARNAWEYERDPGYLTSITTGHLSDALSELERQ